MARSYTKRKRAENQAATRRRIVEAAVELHATVGPAATTISMLAERAGVQRHTIYAHFPDDMSLLQACSGLTMERDPAPDASDWQAITDRHERLRTGLAAIYAWYERNAELVAGVLRDAEHHAPTAKIVAVRMGPRLESYRATLGDGLMADGLAALGLALDFHTWRNLTAQGGCGTRQAVELAARMVTCADTAA